MSGAVFKTQRNCSQLLATSLVALNLVSMLCKHSPSSTTLAPHLAKIVQPDVEALDRLEHLSLARVPACGVMGDCCEHASNRKTMQAHHPLIHRPPVPLINQSELLAVARMTLLMVTSRPLRP